MEAKAIGQLELARDRGAENRRIAGCRLFVLWTRRALLVDAAPFATHRVSPEPSHLRPGNRLRSKRIARRPVLLDSERQVEFAPTHRKQTIAAISTRQFFGPPTELFSCIAARLTALCQAAILIIPRPLHARLS